MDFKYKTKENNKEALVYNELKFWKKIFGQDQKLKDHVYYKYYSSFDNSNPFGNSDIDFTWRPNIYDFTEFLTKNKEAYYHFATKDMFGNIHQVLRHFLFDQKKEPYSLAWFYDKKSPPGLASELARLTEEEREKWISKTGKVDCTLDGRCTSVYKNINNEKRWILENDIASLKINDQEKSKILENKFKVIRFDDNQQKIKYHYYIKDSTLALERIFILNRKVYRTMPQTAYEIFSMYEPKSNFNLIDNLIVKYWTNYPEIHNSDQKTRYRAIAKFANDIKSGKIHEPEVELLGFGKSQKQELSQSQTEKFEAPKLKM
ncbi:hypothetical protein [Mesomycoplasma ovipneumoniae]|uniref:hypothetical protein n=1 Tax=Mesomycoplasma ovipneumoniae TaxID=29562 RepID=UPI0029652FDF|nr:hypothetical protein [Mesomycoplasma ovipneumoniae]MDW2891219.1 hypothetical protein [Mesomycoplasma ovipneumoniae]